MGSDQFCLKWNNYQTSMVQALEMLKMSEELVDVTLSCEGRRMSAHKIILSACSQYFKDIFKENPCQHPVVILKDVRYIDLESLVKYMYAGQVYIAQDQLGRFLKTAETLQVKGLAQNPFISSSTDDAQCERMRNEERQDDERMRTGLTKDEDEDDDEDDDDDEEEEGEEEEQPENLSKQSYQMVEVSSVPQSPQPSNLGVYNTLPHILSLPPLSVPGFITKFPNHPTPPPSLSPSSLPSPGKAICSPIKVPTPPASSFSLKRSSLTSLAQYLSNISPVSLSSLSPPLEHKRRKLSPNKTNPSSLPPSSPPHSSSGEERNSPEGDADSDTEGLVIEETGDDEHARLLNSVFPSNQLRHINATQDGENTGSNDGFNNLMRNGSDNGGDGLSNQGLGKIDHRPDNPDNSNSVRDGQLNSARDGQLNSATHPRNRWRCMQPRVCNYCWKTFSNSFNLKQHIVNVHVQSQGVTCNVCQKVVKNKWYLRKHLVTAHGAPLKRAKNLPSTGLVDVNENEEKMADDETELKYSSLP